jgi:hypothetical protein
MTPKNRSLALACAAAAALWLGNPAPALAVDVAGVKIEDSAKVAGKDLRLNGAGVRTRAIFKVYAMGLSSVSTTGAWSLGRSFLRGSLSMAQAARAPQRLADQDVVDAQALVLAEGQVAVVPPAPALGRLLEEAEGVVQAQPSRLEMRAFLGRAVDLPGPGHRVVDVAVFGRDVEVAHQHQLRVLRASSARSQSRSASSQRIL